MVVYQWNIFWANLDPGKGSEQAGKRPVLVISTEEANEVLPVVTIMAITLLKEGRKIYPTEVLIRAEDTGLSKDSIALPSFLQLILQPFNFAFIFVYYEGFFPGNCATNPKR